MTISELRARLHEGWFYGLLSLIVLALYLPALRFGLIWDDPKWYQQGRGRSLWQFFLPLPTYQFYRPLPLWLNQQLVSTDGVVNAPLAHALQIGAHLVAALISVPVLRALKFDVWHARLAALGFAVFPLAYQAVAWQAPQGPWVVVWLLVAVWTAHAFRQRGQIVLLGASSAAYATALLFQESTLLFVFLFVWLAGGDLWKAPRVLRHWWPGLHLALAGLYVVIWLSVPRQSGVTSQGFQSIVLAYLLQGVAFPAARLSVGWSIEWPVSVLLALFAAVVALLVFGVWRGHSPRVAVLCGAWIAAGLLPVWAGLAWEYVRVGERMLYPASLGVAALWAGWAAWTLTPGPWWRRGLGGIVLVAVLGVSLQQLSQSQRLYRVGTQHLAQAVRVLSAAPEAHILLVNFPDRLEIRPPLYPLGFWGLTLAPVVQNVSDFARATTGASAEDRSRATFFNGAAERDAWPYRVDLRGVNSDPAALFDAALWADAVYLSDFLPNGTLRLHPVGDARPADASSAPLARLGDAAQLVQADVVQAEGLSVRLVWRCLQPLQPEDTIFLHLWRAGKFVSGADGDSLGGLIPPAAWQPGTEIVDLHPIDSSSLVPGTYEVRVGLYNRATGVRYRVTAAQSSLVTEDEIPIGAVHVP